MPYKGGVQLLPETRRQTLARAVSGNRFVYWGLALGAIVLVANIILSAYATSLREQIAAADGKLRLQESQRDKEGEKQLQAAQRQSKLMGQMLRNHLYWSRAFDGLERLMQSGVRIVDLSASVAESKLQFTGATSSYATIARQLSSFLAGEGVRDVRLTAVSAEDAGALEFEGEIDIDTAETLRKTNP